MPEALEPTCPRAGRWFGGCRFEPRYDKRPPDKVSFDNLTYAGSGDPFERLRRETYVHDVCTRCGRTVDRPEAGRRALDPGTETRG